MDYMYVNHLKRMKRKSNILFFILLMTIVSCHKNEEIITTEKVDDPPKVTISTTHVFKVINENGKSINEFSAVFANEPKDIHHDGLAVFNSKLINKYGEIVVIKDNLGNETKLLLSGVENDINYHQLTLFQTKSKITYKTTEKRKIIISNKISLTGVPNSYNNNTYTGDVNVTFFHLDVDNEHHLSGLPAVRRGVRINGTQNFLFIKDAFYIDFKGSQSNLLHGKLTLEGYQDELRNGTLKLWYCDIDAAIWKEVNTYSENNLLNFDHKNSGYYCFADSKPGVFVSGKVSLNERPVSNLQLNFKSLKNESTTSAAGRWITYLPVDAEVKTQLYTTCGQVQDYNFETQNIEIKDLHILINENSKLFSLVKGKVKDCSGKILNGYVLKHHIDSDRFNHYYGPEKLAIYIPSCGLKDVKLSVSDAQGTEKSHAITWLVNDTIETGSWFACNQAQKSFFNLIIGVDNKMYFDTKSQLNADGRMILTVNKSIDNPLLIYAPKERVGTINNSDLNIILEETDFMNNGYEIKCPNSRQGCGFEKFTITHLGTSDISDPFIRGYFSGRFWLKEFPSLKAGYKEMQGEFQVLKSF